MIEDINIILKSSLINDAKLQLPSVDFKLSINEPTGNFFYDPWKIKDQFRLTVWETILNTLPYPIGEARLIKLESGKCYLSHADIDNRWHLNIYPGLSFLVDLENNKMHNLLENRWYFMNAGVIHSAVNFGDQDRYQLVVRQLLNKSNLKNPVKFEIIFNMSVFNWRYIFDQIYSPILNKLNSESKLFDFCLTDSSVTFFTESEIEIPNHKDFRIIKCSGQ
jgi:hypothetical protein